MKFIVLAVLIAGCVAWQPDHAENATLFQVIPRTDNGIVMWVVDETGLVLAASEAPRASVDDVSVEARPDLNEIVVRWFGGVCHHGPTVTLTGSPESLHITVQPDAGPGPSFGACPAVGVFYGVTLTLSDPVVHEAIDVREIR